MTAPTSPIILNYVLREQIGTGSTCTIWRALSLPPAQNLAAIKIVALPSYSRNYGGTDDERKREVKGAMKEFRIQETLKHLNVLRVEGGVEREESEGGWKGGLYILMQLAVGGDLFDKIAPDFGVGPLVSHMYIKQLINGLMYITSRGIIHRDIKPENCLVDGEGNLKIADFGLAAVYKYKGVEKALKDRCGSPPYAAPELAYPEPYKAEPIDVWSSGILLFTLLAGNTPWDEPTNRSPEFSEYLAGTLLDKAPWNRIDAASKALLVQILQPNPAARPTLKQIAGHEWVRKENPFLSNQTGECIDGVGVSREMLRALREAGEVGEGAEGWGEAMDLMSQPQSTAEDQMKVFSQRGLDPMASFQASFKLYSRTSQLPSQKSNPSSMCFFTFYPLASVLQTLSSILTQLSVTHSVIPPPANGTTSYVGRIHFHTRDKRGEVMDASLLCEVDRMPRPSFGGEGMQVEEDENDEGLVVRLLKHKGDPLELKRVWKEVGKCLPGDMVHET